MSRVYALQSIDNGQLENVVELTENEMSMIYEGLRYLVDQMVDNGEDTFQLDALFNKLGKVTV